MCFNSKQIAVCFSEIVLVSWVFAKLVRNTSTLSIILNRLITQIMKQMRGISVKCVNWLHISIATALQTFWTVYLKHWMQSNKRSLFHTFLMTLISINWIRLGHRTSLISYFTALLPRHFFCCTLRHTLLEATNTATLSDQIWTNSSRQIFIRNKQFFDNFMTIAS